jgi:ubiquinone/menaquinone biosynthesis C-methylase UbiE
LTKKCRINILPIFIFAVSFLNPETTVNSLNVLPGMQVADFGCGSGHWAIVLAKLVGLSGTIFAIDVQESALEATRSRAKQANIQTIETLHADVEIPGATKLKTSAVDAVLISNMLFQADEKSTVVTEAARILKPGGRVFLIDWDATESLAGPPAPQRIPRRYAEQLFQDAGLQFDKEFNAGSHHYGLMFRK